MRALLIAMFVSSIPSTLILPMIPSLGEQFGVAAAQLGLLVGIYPLMSMLASPLWGKLSDRFGRKPILILTMIGSAAAYGLMAWADMLGNVWLLLISRFLTGLMAGNFAAATAYVTDITPADKRAQGMGMVDHFSPIGHPVGFFFSAPEVAKGFKIAVIASYLPAPFHQKGRTDAIATAGREMPDGNASLSVNSN